MSHLETGRGQSLVHLQRGAPALTRAHELLAQRCRVIALTAGSPRETLARLDALGVDRFNLMAGQAEAAAALRLAHDAPDRVLALVLEAPTAPGNAAAPAMPTLVLLGTRDGGGATEVPGAHRVFVYDAGAAIGADRPEAFAEVVLDFLERHEAFVISRAATVIHP